MRAYRRLSIAGFIAALTLGASAQAHDRDCNGVVLNGCLNTADFNGGVGYGVDYGGAGGGGYAAGSAYASAFAFAHARAFAFGRSIGVPRTHSGGMHGSFGGGHR